jgi:hypothetical protein
LAFSGNAGSLVRLGERRRARISGAKRREGFFVASEVGELTPDTPLFWSRWPGRKGVRRMMPIHGKNIWRLCKTYGRMIGVPELKPHDLRHGVAMEVLEQQHDLEQVRALQADRHDSDLRDHPPRPAQARGGVLQGGTSVERIKPPFQSGSGRLDATRRKVLYEASEERRRTRTHKI